MSALTIMVNAQCVSVLRGGKMVSKYSSKREIIKPGVNMLLIYVHFHTYIMQSSYIVNELRASADR